MGEGIEDEDERGFVKVAHARETVVASPPFNPA